MVKTPRTRHSKSAKEPVTIDLTPGEVSRVKAEAEKTAASENKAARPNTQTASSAATGPASTRPDAGSPKAAESSVRPSAGEPKPEAPNRSTESEKPPVSASAGAAAGDKPKPASASSGASQTAFGRQDPAKPAPERAHRGGLGAIAAGIAGGVIALAIALGLQIGGLLPAGPTGEDGPDPAIDALQAEITAIREEVAAAGGPSATDPVLDDRLTQAEDRIATLSSTLDTLRSDVSQLGGSEEAAMPDLGPVEERIAAIETALAGLGGSSAPETALAAVDEQITALRDEIAAARETQTTAAGRLDALEQALAALTGRVDEQAETPGTALVIAASALKAAIDRGAPFMTELETYASLSPDAPEIVQLRELAASGVPTRAEIAAETSAAATAMIGAAQPVDLQAGLLDRLWASAQGLVEVRPVGMVEGEGVPEIVARLEAAIAGNDYASAIAEFDSLPDAAKSAGETFMEKVRARHAADGLIDEAVAAALRS